MFYELHYGWIDRVIRNTLKGHRVTLWLDRGRVALKGRSMDMLGRGRVTLWLGRGRAAL